MNKILQRIVRIVSMIVIVVSMLSTPNLGVLAKSSLGLFTNCASQSDIPAAECDALVAVYNSTGGANWNDKTGWLQTDTPCSWFGVICTSGHVTSLLLGIQNGSGWVGNGLLGTIPTQISNLTYLESLVLSGNLLNGSIPVSLGSLAHLTMLDLGKNQLSGSIPSTLGNLTSLQTLNLSINQLSGSIPLELGSLTNLTQLYLYNNQLSGSIPPALGNLTHLEVLYLSRNLLTGPIPAQFGNLTNLTELFLHNNRLTGPIPGQLGSLSQLQSLWLDDNQLSGSIPSSLGNLGSLSVLSLYSNKLTGPIPPQLGKLTNLTELDISNNALTGPIPPQLGNLTNLTHLQLGRNHLSGSFPVQLTNLTNLTLLVVSDNFLTGSIPTQLGNLTKLQWLWLKDTYMAGTIPASFLNLTKLRNLTLTCGFTSTDPKIISFVGGILGIDWSTSCPTNDDLRNSVHINSMPYTHKQNTFATTDNSDPVFPCGSGNRGKSSIWFAYSSASSGVLTVNTFGSNYDTMLAIWKGSRGHLVNLGCNDDTNGHGYQSKVTINVVAKQVYYIEIAGYSGSGTSVLNAAFSSSATPTRTPTITPTPTRTPIPTSKIFRSIPAQDGMIIELNENSNQGGTINSSTATLNLGDSAMKRQFRNILSFKTGADLPDTAVITSVTLKIKLQDILGGGNPVSMFNGFMVDIKNGFFGTSALESTDFQAAASKTVGPFSPPAIGNWYTLNLSGGKAYINKLSTYNGFTQIRLRFSLDDNNDAIGNALRLLSGDAPVSSRPQLIINYYVP